MIIMKGKSRQQFKASAMTFTPGVPADRLSATDPNLNKNSSQRNQMVHTNPTVRSNSMWSLIPIYITRTRSSVALEPTPKSHKSPLLSGARRE